MFLVLSISALFIKESYASLTSAQKQALLDKHNQLRSVPAGTGTSTKPTNMNELFWDDSLASTAQNYVDSHYGGSYCNLQLSDHNDGRSNQFIALQANDNTNTYLLPSNTYVGENAAVRWGYSTDADGEYAKMVQSWYDEYQNYGSPSSPKAYGQESKSGVIGHYTQLIWAKTRFIGCGSIEKSCTINGNTYPKSRFLFCNYFPGGNMLGEYPYKAGTKCSSCDRDRSICSSTSNKVGLCSGCMDSRYLQNNNNYDTQQLCQDDLGNSFATTPTKKPTAKPVAPTAPTSVPAVCTKINIDANTLYTAYFAGEFERQVGTNAFKNSNNVYFGVSSSGVCGYYSNLAMTSYYSREVNKGTCGVVNDNGQSTASSTFDNYINGAVTITCTETGSNSANQINLGRGGLFDTIYNSMSPAGAVVLIFLSIILNCALIFVVIYCVSKNGCKKKQITDDADKHYTQL